MSVRDSQTVRFIKNHQQKVQKNAHLLCSELIKRADEHDKSKLEEPELTGWEEMDKEPRYEYGTEEYFEKQERYRWVFQHHYLNNKHHPEYWRGFLCDMDLIDVLEMICDWASFDYMTYTDAIEIIEQQMDRFGFNGLLKSLILNTFKNYFCITESEKDTIKYNEKWGDILNSGTFDFELLRKYFG